MDHIGIDLGSRDSQVCMRNSAGAITEEARRPTTELSEPTGPHCCSQRAHVDAEFGGQLVQRQQFGSSRVIGDHGSGSREDRRRDRSPSATHSPTHANDLPTRLPTRTWKGSDGF